MIGSRFGIDTSKIDAFCKTLYARSPEIVVVSGGAAGADTAAEQAWRALGGEVVSLRPTPRAPNSWTIMRVLMGSKTPMDGMYDLYHQGHPTWETFEGAAFYRNMVIADECERACVWWNGKSAGTRNAMDLFHGRDKPVHLMS